MHFFDTVSGKPLGKPVTHAIDVLAVAINQNGAGVDRLVALLDKNRDLFLTHVMRSQHKLEKVCCMCIVCVVYVVCCVCVCVCVCLCVCLFFPFFRTSRHSFSYFMQFSFCFKFLLDSHPPRTQLGTMVLSFTWHEKTNMLAALTDGKLIVWYCPSTVYNDKAILPKTRIEIDAA